MTDPTSVSSVLLGTGAASIATLVLGPVLGVYAVIIGMGLLGTLVALTDEDFSAGGQPPSWSQGAWRAAKFIFRGVALSVAFAGLIAHYVSGSFPADSNITPYAVLTPVAFTIGWTSNKWTLIKEKIVEVVGGVLGRFFGGKNGNE